MPASADPAAEDAYQITLYHATALVLMLGDSNSDIMDCSKAMKGPTSLPEGETTSMRAAKAIRTDDAPLTRKKRMAADILKAESNNSILFLPIRSANRVTPRLSAASPTNEKARIAPSSDLTVLFHASRVPESSRSNHTLLIRRDLVR